MKIKYGFVKKAYPTKCKGVAFFGKPALKVPIDIEIEMYKSPGYNFIAISPICPYNVGGHGQRCKASHPNIDKREDGRSIYCRYSVPSLHVVMDGIIYLGCKKIKVEAKDGTLVVRDSSTPKMKPELQKFVKDFLEQILEK